MLLKYQPMTLPGQQQQRSVSEDMAMPVQCASTLVVQHVCNLPAGRCSW